MTRTLLVGLDSACWEYVDPLLQAGRMPTLQRLIDTGASGILHSTMPPWTPAAWASLATGKQPGKHGVFDMMWRDGREYSFIPTSARVRAGTPFWSHLNAHGVRVGLVNVPFTYPPEPLDGFVVCGFGTPPSAQDVAYPHGALQGIQRTLGGYEPVVPAELLRTASPEEIFVKESHHQSTQVRIAAELTTRHPVDVLVINLMFTDHANHKFPEMAQVEEAYCRSDADLDELIEAFSPDNVMLISDHGSSRLKGDFLLYAWLRDHGYYVEVANDPRERVLRLNWLLVEWFRHHDGWPQPFEKLIRRLLRESFFRWPARMQTRFWHRIERLFPAARDHVLLSAQPDYRRTPVFPGSVYSGLLYLNLQGREPTGVLPAQQRRDVAAELTARLLSIEEPEAGGPLLSNVYLAEELYAGTALDHAPDLILDGYDSGWNLRSSRYVSLREHERLGYFVPIGNGRDFGWHSRDGMFVFSGPAFEVASTFGEGHLVDVPATLLHLYDVPVPQDYDGRVMEELISPSHRRPVRVGPADGEVLDTRAETISSAEMEMLADHLRALGYLD